MTRRTIEGSRTIITGASSGIGRELARALADRGARIVLNARRTDRLEELAAELQQAGADVDFVAGDVSIPETRELLVQKTVGSFGGIDLLVNNAGIGAIGCFSDAAEDRLRRIMEVNLFAPIELTRIALPHLIRGVRPMIVNVSSVLGHRAVPKKSEYCASKFALHGFSDALRAELSAQGVDVLLVSPSTTSTEFFDNVIENNGKLPWLKLGGMNATRVARKTVRAIKQGRHEIILTPGGKLLVWLDRLSPPVINRLVARFG